ncbi:MAG: methyltransferase domain-containing protein [Syntrophomonas sp.]
MEKLNFSSKAASYEQTGLVQKMTGHTLLNLADISSSDSVLDLGCGPGTTTARIAQMTTGRVVGVDVSEGMIDQAVATYSRPANLHFVVKDAAQLDYLNEFDHIYCNSALQWFTDPKPVVRECWKALKPGGSMVIQSPATSRYCPIFLEAITGFATNPETAALFKHFKSPYFFLDSAQEYRELFTRCGFIVNYCEFECESNHFTVDEVMGIFRSGAENGYLNQAYYDVALDSNYIDTCRGILRSLLQRKADSDNKVALEFTRVYLKVHKP